MKRHQPLIFCFFLLSVSLQAQSVITLERTLQWDAKPSQFLQTNGENREYWQFADCTFGDEATGLPMFTERFPLAERSSLRVTLASANYEPLALKVYPENSVIGETPNLNAFCVQERSKFFGWVRLLPIRRTASGGYEKLVSFILNIEATPEPITVTERGGPYTTISALNSGSIYKFGVAQSTVYKLDYNFLKSDLGISDLDNIDPKTIRLYGNGGAMLSEKNSDPRPDDLTENAIQVVGEEDGKFNSGDYILFYAQGPNPWTYKASTTDPELSVKTNLYDRYAWYFVKTGDGVGLRVQNLNDVNATATTETFDDVRRVEDEKVNLLDFNQSSQGSGKRWFGDYFFQTREKEYEFEFPNLVAGSTARLRTEFAGRCDDNTTFRLIYGTTTFSKSIGGVSTSNNEAPYASSSVITGTIAPAGDKFSVKIQYPNVSATSEGWLDYIEINARRKLAMSGRIMEFRDLQTINNDATKFRISNVTGGTLNVWNVTNPQAPARQQLTNSGDIAEFSAETSVNLRNFIAFYENADFPKPETKVGKLANQNLHAIDNVHMVILYPSIFESQATQLAEHRRTFSGLDIALVHIDELYNEFSSGRKDPTAIRDFARMLYERNPEKFEYLLLLGDGSFDPKNNTETDLNLDFIPVFETQESYSPIYAYPSDDYMGLITPDDNGSLIGALDIAVGRIPARNTGEAQAVVDKIIAYDKSPELLADWHLRSVFMGDDEDGNAHINQADKLAGVTASTEEWFNIEKIYFDAYQQVATSGGQRFPDAKSAINSNVFKGALVMQYIGHGGPRGWAQERVVDQNDIADWDNPNRYPLIITATCSFGGYDDYSILTGGEQALLKSNSGAIALFTTVRAVFITDNNKLTDGVQKYLFQQVNGSYRPIGDILKVAKNSLTSGSENARRFTLLGDPAMFLAMPEYGVRTTKINGHDISDGQNDTLRALMPVEIEGAVTDTAGNVLSNFNGKVSVSIFDKAQDLQTLGQDAGSSVRNFSVQRNIIFKGSATVTDGRFKISFIVPKDINYNYGAGKISYYAENSNPINGHLVDAAGAYRGIIVGGNANLISDDQAPKVQVFLNTADFVNGGITNNDPKILVKCSDDYGMNVSGTSLGHDLTAVLDNNVQETIVLNDFYESSQDNYRTGQALYPLHNLSVGRHTLRVKGWDIANNPGEGYTEFVVAEDGKAALDHVLNYPNPFTTNTSFQFEHNLSGQLLDVQVSIFTVSGKLVKTLNRSAGSNSFRVTDLSWDGRDEYGDPLARGVYVYRVKVRGTDANGATITAESDFEKLVILK